MKIPLFPAGLGLALLAFVWSSPAQLPTPPVAASPTPAIQSGGEVAARTAAEVWLALVDDGRYEQSYDESASIFKGLISKDKWVELARGGREPLGKLVTRKLKDATFTKTLPGAPDGQYVVIHFDTSFDKKLAAVETVTPMLDKDGEWRVSGYFIR